MTPPTLLSNRKLIRKVWVLDNTCEIQHTSTKPMVFDGCLEIIYAWGDGFQMVLNNQIFTYPAGLYLGGQITQQMSLRLQPGTRLYFLKVEPWVINRISNFTMREITNLCTPFEEINRPLARRIQQLNPVSQMDKIINTLGASVENHHLNTTSRLLVTACDRFPDFADNFRAWKDGILDEFGISSRTLENKFKDYIGITPKKYASMLRLRKALEYIQYHQKHQNLTRIAYDLGYYDQAHFARAMKSFTGFSPKQLDFDELFIPDSNEHFRYFTI